MNRTFHYRVSFLNYAAIVVVAACALFAFWHRSAPNVVLGVGLMAVVVLMVERIIHTSYVFTDDGMLVVCKGRFSRTLTILKYVLVRYGAGREISLQPVNDEAFISEVRRRQALVESVESE